VEGPGTWGPIFVQLVEGLQSELGPPTPSPLASVSPIWIQMGWGATLACVGRGPIRTTGQKACQSVYSVVQQKTYG
jgi:hypothetical protein